MKANHNYTFASAPPASVVSSTTKIVKWKQITTRQPHNPRSWSCFQYDKDSKMKANHNPFGFVYVSPSVVSSTTKIVKWKQITTGLVGGKAGAGCFQYDKDSKMKANHNWMELFIFLRKVVSSTTKIVKWKQITTTHSHQLRQRQLFPVRQR